MVRGRRGEEEGGGEEEDGDGRCATKKLVSLACLFTYIPDISMSSSRPTHLHFLSRFLLFASTAGLDFLRIMASFC